MIRYRARAGVTLHHGDPPYFMTPEGGVVVTDAALARIWAAAHAQTLADLTARFATDAHLSDIVSTSMACLAEAGLILRDGDAPNLREPTPATEHRGALVSIVIVVSGARELEFLDDCLQSIAATTYRPFELLIVDNDSQQDLRPLVRRRVPSAEVVSLAPRRCLAAASNAALDRARGDYALLMNPDVKLTPTAVARLVRRAACDTTIAAVVPKTRFWRTPAFLNAIGNRVEPHNWGTDNGIGQLDLGQLDDWRTAPSASLTIVLLTRRAWIDVGPFDDRYPAYYEDADWAYRARLMGRTIAAEPTADVFHIFGGFWDAPPGAGLSNRKLRTAVLGRLRFVAKIAAASTMRRWLRNYALEDICNIGGTFWRGEFGAAAAYVRAWSSLLAAARKLRAERSRIQGTRVIDDAALFASGVEMPRSCTHRNSPVLTTRLVRELYAPLLRSGRTRPVPETGPDVALTTDARGRRGPAGDSGSAGSDRPVRRASS